MAALFMKSNAAMMIFIFLSISFHLIKFVTNIKLTPVLKHVTVFECIDRQKKNLYWHVLQINQELFPPTSFTLFTTWPILLN